MPDVRVTRRLVERAKAGTRTWVGRDGPTSVIVARDDIAALCALAEACLDAERDLRGVKYFIADDYVNDAGELIESGDYVTFESFGRIAALLDVEERPDA